MRRLTSGVMLTLLLAGVLVLGVHRTAADEIAIDSKETDVYACASDQVPSSFPFESIFRNDLLDIASSIPEIVEIYIKSYLDMRPIALWACIRINYTSGLSDMEKVDLQYTVEDELALKWYIDFVEPNYIYWIPEAPPPPWPGFVIGDLNVRFIDSPVVNNVNTSLSYETIQAAINANETLKGHTICVSSGTYYENVVVNKTVTLLGEDRETTLIDGGGFGHAVSITENNVTIAGLTIVNSMQSTPYSGIYLDNVKNSNILGNAILGGYRGVWLQNSSGNVIRDNIISNISDSLAIWLHESNDNAILENIIRNCSSGIYVYHSDNNRVQNNHVTNITYYGIALAVSGGTVIECNIVSSHVEWYGISLYTSNDSSIIGNSIIDCTPGLRLTGSSDNTIYHNNFINNTTPLVLLDDPLNNSWDSGCEGNYWSNYNGTDLDGDGIGDTFLPSEGADNYPLMNLYWNPGDIDHDLDVDIFDVVTCALAYGSTPSDHNWNPHCDVSEPFGEVDILDIVMIATSYGEEYTP